jgi:hypothetical protein
MGPLWRNSGAVFAQVSQLGLVAHPEDIPAVVATGIPRVNVSHRTVL